MLIRPFGLMAVLVTACAGGASAQAVEGDAAKSDLTITCGLHGPAGAANPLAGRAFVLLKQSFNDYLMQHHLFTGPPGTVMETTPLMAWAYASRTGAPIAAHTVYEARSLFITSTKLDSAGSGDFKPVPPGTYYVFGQGVYENMQILWDARVDLHAGKNEFVLDKGNMARNDIAPTKPASPAGAGTAATPKRAVAAAPPIAAAPRRPSGPKDSILDVHVVAGSEHPVGRTTFYLLDDNFENILKRAGYKSQMLLGEEQPLLNSFELQARWLAMDGSSPLAALAGSSGESIVPPEIKAQYELARKALAEHTVATITTGGEGVGTTARVPEGGYYLYGVANQYVKDGYRGSVYGGTVTLNEQGHQAATIWNVKVVLKSGRNSLKLSPANAAFTGN